MGSVVSDLAKRFDGEDPVLNGPIETAIMFGVCKWRRPLPATASPAAALHNRMLTAAFLASTGTFTLISMVYCVQRASGVSMKDRDGDGVPDMQ